MMPPPTQFSHDRAEAGALRHHQIRRFESPAAAAALGWDDALTLPPFMSTDWLAALAPQASGGAGGPATELVQVTGPDDRIVAQLLDQRLPVAAMRLGGKVRPSLVARTLGPTARQLGQALFSGPAHASTLSPKRTADLLAAVSHARNTSGVTFVKDVPAVPRAAPWLEVDALPEMALAIRPAWRSFGDYLAALPSKYRSRARRARKLGARLTTRVLDADAASGFGESIQRLYDGLMARTPYAPFIVEAGYVPRLKRLRPSATTLLGYFDGGRMVGFATLLVDGGHAVAHLAAVDPAYNPSHQLYLNVLFDLLSTAIARGCTRLNYGRTATTIKSSLGATPHYYVSAVRHSGCVRNGLLRRFAPMVLDPGDKGQLIQQPLR